MNNQAKNGNLIAIITMFFLFAMISFVTNLAAPFGTIWRNAYEGSNVLGMMGNMMDFLAYLFMGIRAGILDTKRQRLSLWVLVSLDFSYNTFLASSVLQHLFSNLEDSLSN